jgi:hypothetical protein
MVSLDASRTAVREPVILQLVFGGFAPWWPAALLVVAVAMGAALTWACLDRSAAWVAWGVAAPLVCTAWAWLAPNAAVRSVTWPWWNDPSRIRVLAVLPAVLALVALGVRLVDQAAAAQRIPRLGWVLTAQLALAAPLLAASSHEVGRTYHPDDSRDLWATPSERADLARLAMAVPLGSTVAANPWSGGTHLYLTRDLTLLYPTEWSAGEHKDLLLLGRRLEQIENDPAVCAAARRHDVQFVVTGGDVTRMGIGRGGTADYVGLERVGDDTGFQQVRSSGPFTLWRVPECPGG